MTQDLRENLAKAPDYRSFLALVVEERGGCAAFSRRAKFSSRSFLSEVLRGHRRLSHASYLKVSKALKLPGEQQRLFQLLVAREEPDIVSLANNKKIDAKIANLREKMLTAEDTRNEAVFVTTQIPVVYAALGEQDKGSTLDAILSRTKLRATEVKESLQILISKGLAAQSGETYFSTGGDVDLFDLHGTQSFQQTFAETSSTLQKLVMEVGPSPEHLFFFTAFPIDNPHMVAFKQELRDAVLSIIDKYQNDAGNSVVRLNLGYFS